MRALKIVLFGLVLLALISAAFLSYVLLAPVTADNVKCRLTSICAMGTAALRLHAAAAGEFEKLSKGSCGCLSGRLVNEAGPEIAASVTEGARRLGVFGIRRKLNAEPDQNVGEGGAIEKSGMKDRVIQGFSERCVKAANACEAEAV